MDNGTLSFEDTVEVLLFDATIVEEVAKISWVQDLFQLVLAGLSIGLSPGFRIPPPRAVPADQAQQIDQEPYDPGKGMMGAILRTILEAILFELSIVTRPAYNNATVEMRNWTVENGVARPGVEGILRWRLKQTEGVPALLSAGPQWRDCWRCACNAVATHRIVYRAPMDAARCDVGGRRAGGMGSAIIARDDHND